MDEKTAYPVHSHMISGSHPLLQYEVSVSVLHYKRSGLDHPVTYLHLNKYTRILFTIKAACPTFFNCRNIHEVENMRDYAQYLKGSYGSVDMGASLAVIVMSLVPMMIVYILCQKHIIKGIAAGAVKG